MMAEIISPRRKPESIVFEGGGVLGAAYIGAVEELEELGVLNNVNNYVGTSIGSLFATILSCGKDSKYLFDKLKNIDFNKLTDYGSIFRGIYNFIFHKGACDGVELENWLTEILAELISDKDKLRKDSSKLSKDSSKLSKDIKKTVSAFTFSDHFKRFGKKLYVTVYNISADGAMSLNVDDTPDMSLLLGLKMALSLPGAFMPVLYNGEYYIDGGIVDNMSMRVVGDTNTIGLLLQTSMEVSTPAPITGLLSYGSAIINAVLNTQQKIHIEEVYWKNIIKINCGHIKSTDFNITEGEISRLIDGGREGVRGYYISSTAQSAISPSSN